jgi:hypothetical protein
MGNKPRLAKLLTGTDFANLAACYRRIAATMPDGRSRERLMSMARAMEARIAPGPDDGRAP